MEWLGVWSIMWVEISTAAALPSVLCSSRSLCASPCQTADHPTQISTMPTCQRLPPSPTAGTVAAAGPPGAWCPLWAPTSTSGVMENYSSGLTPRGERSHDHSDYHRKLNPENKHHRTFHIEASSCNSLCLASSGSIVTELNQSTRKTDSLEWCGDVG